MATLNCQLKTLVWWLLWLFFFAPPTTLPLLRSVVDNNFSRFSRPYCHNRSSLSLWLLYWTPSPVHQSIVLWLVLHAVRVLVETVMVDPLKIFWVLTNSTYLGNVLCYRRPDDYCGWAFPVASFCQWKWYLIKKYPVEETGDTILCISPGVCIDVSPGASTVFIF